MQTETLQAEVRAGRGKGPARRLRAAGRIPAVVYGPGQEPAALAVSPNELTRALSGKFGRNQVLTLKWGAGEKALTMVKDLDVHPVSRELRHVDFYLVDENRLVSVVVPFETKGRPVGVAKGGVLSQSTHSLHVRCVPTKIPAAIVADVTSLDINGVFAVQDLDLEDGLEVQAQPNVTLAAVLEPRLVLEEKTASEDEVAEPVES